MVVSKLRFFTGCSDRLDDLNEAIVKFIDSPVTVDKIDISVHFHVEDRTWNILVVVRYHDQQRGGIVVPSLSLHQGRKIQ